MVQTSILQAVLCLILKAPVRKYVQDNAPDGWYQNITQLYKKALNWQYNKQAAVVVEQDQQQSSQHTELARSSSYSDKRRRSAVGKRTERYRPQEFETNAPSVKRGKKGGGRGDNKAQGSGASQGPTDVEFKARIEAGKCSACGMAGHRYKNEAGEKTQSSTTCHYHQGSPKSQTGLEGEFLVLINALQSSSVQIGTSLFPCFILVSMTSHTTGTALSSLNACFELNICRTLRCSTALSFVVTSATSLLDSCHD